MPTEYVEEIGMTNEEFLEEALKSPECPSNFKSMYRYFCKYQKMAIETLVEVSEIFKKILKSKEILWKLIFLKVKDFLLLWTVVQVKFRNASLEKIFGVIIGI